MALSTLTSPGAGQVGSYAEEHPAVRYGSRTPSSRVERLRQALARGEVRLAHDPVRGYLPALLERLDIPIESQVLVYSRTSLQEGFISPRTPRAVYFAEDAYVAWVQQGEELEVAAVDPVLGPTFYTLRQDATVPPALQRRNETCLECHDTYGLTGGGVPRLLVGSGLVDRFGRPAVHGQWRLTTHATPLERRWGGWYVTGTHGDQTHMGNVVLDDPTTEIDFTAHGNLTSLAGLLDTGPYLAPHSDIVALLLLEHQTHVQNVLTRLGWEARGLAPDGAGREAALDELVEPAVRALLLAGEAPLEDRVRGTSGFREAFEARGRRDEEGRSLRDLGLRGRLFRYPLSYLVHSAQVTALPEEARHRLYGRIRKILSGEDRSGAYDHVRPDEGAAALEILEATDEGYALWLRARE